MTTIFEDIGTAMMTGGYANFKEFADAAIAAGFHDDQNIDLAGFINSGIPQTNQGQE